MVMDFGVVADVSRDALAPTVLLAAGQHFASAGGHGETGTSYAPDEDVDLFRDTMVRYAGYANELGEAFGPLLPAFVPFSYAIAVSYVAADAIDKVRRARGIYKDQEVAMCSAIDGLDAFVWQMLVRRAVPPGPAPCFSRIVPQASVVMPGFTIHQVVAIVGNLVDAAGLDGGAAAVLPTLAGLAAIPCIMTPLDELAEVAMDAGPRRVTGPYLESCRLRRS